MTPWSADFWADSTILTPIGAILLLLAPFLGSFVGVLIDRVPRGEGVVAGRSACRQCGHKLGARDLVPIVSFVAARGRCRHCGTAIPRRDLAIELASLGVAALSLIAPDPAEAACGLALGLALLALGGIDMACLRLPDFLTLPLILAGLAEAAWLEPDALADRAIAAALGFLLFYAVAQTYRKWRGRAGLGLGDAKLLAAGGAWTGCLALPYIVLIAAGLGLIWALGTAWRQRHVDLTQRLPFGPFLAVGIFTLFLWRALPFG